MSEQNDTQATPDICTDQVPLVDKNPFGHGIPREPEESAPGNPVEAEGLAIKAFVDETPDETQGGDTSGER
jgi:hypothetical protein